MGLFRHRLVLPPLYAAVILLVACPTLLRVVGFRDPVISVSFWSAYLVGYVLYDSTHYFLHFLDTKRFQMGWFQSLQQYHNQHHYGGEHAGFGVSSPLWDIILRSGYKAKKHVK
jgi:4-hydroxysphinganine ceramide fatty acyl 2-hydroxylase